MAEPQRSGGFFARGWFMVGVVFVVAICTVGFGLYSFSMIRIPMTEMLGCDPTQVAFGFSLYTLSTAFASLIAGDIIEKFTLRGALIISAILLSGGFFLLGTLSSLWMVYVAYIVMGTGAAIGGSVVVSGVPSNWFVKRRGIAVGIVWCATLPASIITNWLVSSATAIGNWQQAAIMLGVIALVVLLIASFILKWRPQEVGLLPDGMTAEEAAKMAESAGAVKLVGLTRTQALKSPTFWFIFIAFALVGIGEQGPFQNFTTYMTQLGYDLSTAGTYMTFLAFAGCCGKLTAGLIVDKVGPKGAYSGINFCAAAGLFCIVLWGENPLVLFVAGFFFGAALSSSTVCFSNATSKYLGPKHFGRLYGIVFLGKPIMDSIGVPLLTAISGSALGWAGAFSIAGLFVVASAVCMLFTRKDPLLAKMEEQAACELAEETSARVHERASQRELGLSTM